jgi:putative FmdB family regulatory protein
LWYSFYMPLYAYFCNNCGKETEEIQKFDAPPPEVCPHCEAEKSLEKKVGGCDYHLKGGGWYKDGY